jgi:hypothetical protein
VNYEQHKLQLATDVRCEESYTVNVVPTSPILDTLMTEALLLSKRRFLKDPHGVTCQKTSFFIATAVKTSNLTFGIFKIFLDHSKECDLLKNESFLKVPTNAVL